MLRRSCLLGCLLLALPARAHHSIAAVYDAGQRLTIEGVVTRFEFIHPHPFLHIDVVDQAGGPAVSWRLEMDNRFELAAIGVTAGTFIQGDHVVVTGTRERSGGPGLYLYRLERKADGLVYQQVGFSPRLTLPVR